MFLGITKAQKAGTSFCDQLPDLKARIDALTQEAAPAAGQGSAADGPNSSNPKLCGTRGLAAHKPTFDWLTTRYKDRWGHMQHCTLCLPLLASIGVIGSNSTVLHEPNTCTPATLCIQQSVTLYAALAMQHLQCVSVHSVARQA